MQISQNVLAQTFAINTITTVQSPAYFNHVYKSNHCSSQAAVSRATCSVCSHKQGMYMAARVRGDGGEAGSGTQLRKQHSTSYVRSLSTGATLSLQLTPLLHGVGFTTGGLEQAPLYARPQKV